MPGCADSISLWSDSSEVALQIQSKMEKDKCWQVPSPFKSKTKHKVLVAQCTQNAAQAFVPLKTVSCYQHHCTELKDYGWYCQFGVEE